MQCIFCGAELDKSDKCPVCGEDVKLVKRILATSNVLYNEGLKRASVRDLSGAVEVLKASLKLYKKNTSARNLLGLVYFEMGEQVNGLTEWVISKNYQPEKNLAEEFLDRIQNSPNTFENINQTAKKYNQSLIYCRQDGEDLAVIQLKKVVAQNPNMIKAHQLLALLFMKEGRYDLAKKYLKAAAKIDTNNTTTMHYLKVCNQHLPDKAGRRKKENEDLVSYQSGNETIIVPKQKRDLSTAASVILNLLIGIGLGVLITWFLVVPGIRQNEKKNANESLLEANDAISDKEQTILSLQNQIDEMQSQVDAAKSSTEETQVVLSTYQQLLNAYIAYVSGNAEGASEALAQVNSDYLDVTGKSAYDAVTSQIVGDILGTDYEAGYQSYQDGKLSEAISHLLKVVEMDETYHDGDALYYLTMAYRKDKDDANGVLYSQKIIQLYPGTDRAEEARRYLDSLGVAVNENGIEGETEG